jgi:DNA-binding NarL/FixJ family response regulator
LAHQKQILVLESEKLLVASILSLLASRPEYDVTSTTLNSLNCIDQPNGPEPDVVILDEELVAANISDLVALADRHPTLRLIVLGLNDNELHIFDKHIVHVSQVNDFFELLKSSLD